jgi:hypothetical protein
MNALPNVFNSQWEYFITSHGYNGCSQKYSIDGCNNKKLMLYFLSKLFDEGP